MKAETKQATQYTNGTAFTVIVKQSNGSTYELNKGMSATADKDTYFTALKYPAISGKWFKINTGKIRSHN